MPENILESIFERYPYATFLQADGFDEAVIGVHDCFVDEPILIYSVRKCLDILEQDMDPADALEYFEYNVSGAYVGKQTPIWCQDDF